MMKEPQSEDFCLAGELSGDSRVESARGSSAAEMDQVFDGFGFVIELTGVGVVGIRVLSVVISRVRVSEARTRAGHRGRALGDADLDGCETLDSLSQQLLQAILILSRQRFDVLLRFQRSNGLLDLAKEAERPLATSALLEAFAQHRLRNTKALSSFLLGE